MDLGESFSVDFSGDSLDFSEPFGVSCWSPWRNWSQGQSVEVGYRWEYSHCPGGGSRGVFRKREAARALLKRWLLLKVVVVKTPGMVEDWGRGGDGVGEAVTDMSSSGGDNGIVVLSSPCPSGEAFGEVVLCGLQLIEMGPRLFWVDSETKSYNKTIHFLSQLVPFDILGDAMCRSKVPAKMWWEKCGCGWCRNDPCA